MISSNRLGKKGVDLTINTMIIMALALIILIILAVLVVNGAINFNKGKGCAPPRGECKPSCLDTEFMVAWTCEGSDVCCSTKPFG
jgi:hypothetical protein